MDIALKHSHFANLFSILVSSKARSFGCETIDVSKNEPMEEQVSSVIFLILICVDQTHNIIEMMMR